MRRNLIIGLLVIMSVSFFTPTQGYSWWKWKGWNNLSTIISPRRFQKLDSYPVEIIVHFNKGANPETFRAWLNRRDITDKFKQTENGVRALVSPEDGLRIKVKGKKLSKGSKINILKTKISGPRGKKDIDIREFFVIIKNHPPVANAGDDQLALVNYAIVLDGTRSYDQEDAPLTYEWSIVSRPLESVSELDDPSSSTPVFSPDQEGEYVFQLVVNDGGFDSEPDTVVVTSVSPEDSPVADWNPVTGTPHRISGISIAVSEILTQENIEKITRNILFQYKDLLQTDPDVLVLLKAEFLQAVYPHGGAGTWYIYYGQTYHDIPVHGGSVRLVIRNQKLTHMGSDFYPGISISPDPEISRDQAIQIVNPYLPEIQPISTELLILPKPVFGEIHYYLAWQITMPVTHAPMQDVDEYPGGGNSDEDQTDVMIPVQWRYFVDAGNGSIIDRINLMRYENLSGTVTGMTYIFSPLDPDKQEVPISDISLTAMQGLQTFETETDPNGQYGFTGLTPGSVDIEAQLKGPHIRIYNEEIADATHIATAMVPFPGTHDWNWEPDDQSPDDVETNAYYHVKFIRDWFNRGDSFNVTPHLSLQTDPNCVEVFVRDGYYCNASASIVEGKLFFGSGDLSGYCQDHALCADFIYHEFTHLIVAQIYEDAGVSFLYYGVNAAMHEAFADYFPSSINDDPEFGEGCSISPRNIDVPDRQYPDNIMNLPHLDGMILSGAIWDMRTGLGRDYADNLAFRALKHVPISYSEYLCALLEEDDDSTFSQDPNANNNPLDGTPNDEAICDAFYTSHGIYHSYCANKTQIPVAIITSPSPMKDAVNFFDGSTSIISIEGTALGSRFNDFFNYELHYTDERNLGVWLTTGISLIDNGEGPVEDGILGEWDITNPNIEDGYYLIRLTVTDMANEISYAYTSVIIDRALMPNWPKLEDSNLFFRSPPAIGDLDPNYPGLEIVSRGGGWLYAWHADGTPVNGDWPIPWEGYPSTSPALADLDADGNLEVVIVANGEVFLVGYGVVRVFYHDGSEAADWPKVIDEIFSVNMIPSIADLDQNGTLEIVVGTKEGTVYAWCYDGNPMPEFWPVTVSGSVESPAALGDLNNDGALEVVVGTDEGDIYVFNHNGSLVSNWPVAMGSGIMASPALADLDGDGDLEIVASSNSQVYAWHHDGNSVVDWPKNPGEEVGSTSMLFADLDRDGNVEVLVQSALKKIYAWYSLSGTQWTQWPVSPFSFCDIFSIYPDSGKCPVVGDIDGNGDMEIVTAAESWHLGSTQAQFEELGSRSVHKVLAFNHQDATLVSGFPKYVLSPYLGSSPVLADIDQNGDLEIILGAYGVYIWDIPGVGSSIGVEWPEYRSNSQRTGQYVSHYTDLAIEWTFTTNGMIHSSPAIGNSGTIYVGSTDGNLYAINPEDGSQKWAFSVGGSMLASPTVGDDETIYIGSPGALLAIDPNGNQRWRFDPPLGAIWSCPAIGSDGTVYVGSIDGNLYAIDPNGTQEWVFPTGDEIWTSPAIDANGVIYVGSYDENLYAINPDGTQKWTSPVGSWLVSSPTIGGDGTIYIGSFSNGYVYAINPDDGFQKWAFDAGLYLRSSPTIGIDGTIYIGSPDFKLYAIHPDGTQKWAFTTSSHVTSTPVIGADGIVYVESVDGHLYEINPDNGTQKGILTIGGYWNHYPVSPAMSSDGTIYMGSVDGNLYAIHTSSGGLANTPWPMFHHDERHTGRQ